jgi:hypothetical protein
MVRAHNESSINGVLLQGRGALCPITTPRQPRPSSPRGFCFLGESHTYPKGQHVAGGRGSFYVSNPRRSLRKLTPGGPCPFCGWRAGIGLTAHACRLGGDARGGYVVADNQNPIVAGQLLVVPVRHRCMLAARDVELLIRLVCDGLGRQPWQMVPDCQPLPAEAMMRSWAAYVNPTPGSGRSQRHFHAGLVPADGVPLPVTRPSDWPVCRGVGAAQVLRAEGLGCHALLVRGPSRADAAATVEALDRHFRAIRLSYNLLVFRSPVPGRKPQDVDLVVIPRGAERCTAVDQKVAGLELLTGVLIPGPECPGPMCTARRDEAFRQATLDECGWDRLVRGLRSVFGLSTSGPAVFAVAKGDLR